MKCEWCNNKGYTETSILSGDQEQKSYSKCPRPDCKHTHKYYVFIREKYASQPKDNVIKVDFRNRKREEEA